MTPTKVVVDSIKSRKKPHKSPFVLFCSILSVNQPETAVLSFSSTYILSQLSAYYN